MTSPAADIRTPLSKRIDLYLVSHCVVWSAINPFKPKFTIVIFIHYKPQIAVTILDL